MTLANLLLWLLALVVGLTVFIATLPSDPDWCSRQGGHLERISKSLTCVVP